jgi:hypothetical protein
VGLVRFNILEWLEFHLDFITIRVWGTAWTSRHAWTCAITISFIHIVQRKVQPSKLESNIDYPTHVSIQQIAGLTYSVATCVIPDTVADGSRRTVAVQSSGLSRHMTAQRLVRAAASQVAVPTARLLVRHLVVASELGP